MKKTLYNFYGDLLIIISGILCIIPRNSTAFWWTPHFGMVLSGIVFLSALCFAIKRKKLLVCEMYTLGAAFFSVAIILRYHFFAFYIYHFPIIETAFTAVKLLVSLLGLARMIHYLRNKQIDDYFITKEGTKDSFQD